MAAFLQKRGGHILDDRITDLGQNVLFAGVIAVKSRPGYAGAAGQFGYVDLLKGFLIHQIDEGRL